MPPRKLSDVEQEKNRLRDEKMIWNGKVWEEEYQGEKDRGIIIGYITPNMTCRCMRCGVLFLPKQGRLPKACPACTTTHWKNPVKNKLLSEKAKERFRAGK